MSPERELMMYVNKLTLPADVIEKLTDLIDRALQDAYDVGADSVEE